MSADSRIAAAFHTAYEALAAEYGYRTQPATAVPWTQVPDTNKALMIAVVGRLIEQGEFTPGPGCPYDCGRCQPDDEDDQ